MTAVKLCFEELALMEPGLNQLLWLAHNAGDDENYCFYDHWYGHANRVGLRERMKALVGWNREADNYPALTTADAYETAYAYLVDALPDCRCHHRRTT